MGGFYGHIHLGTLSADIHHHKNPYGDVVSFHDSNTSVQADGYIYNLQELKTKFAQNSDQAAVQAAFSSAPLTFPNALRGEFTSLVKYSNRLEISTNHSCSRRVFYAVFNGLLYFHYNLRLLQEKLDSVGFSSSPNIVALRSLISIGGVFGNQTVVEGVNLLRAGEKIVVSENGWTVEKYYSPETKGTSVSKTASLQTLHEQFLKTVKHQYDHPEIMGFQLLSGGLDSRMNLSLVAQNNIRQQAVLCFGQTNYRDHWISQQIAEQHHLKYDFVPLENGDYLTAIDENILAVDGLCFYASSAHFNYALNHTKYISPIIHTGQVGRTIFTEHPFGMWQNLSEYSALLCSSKYADSINSEVKEEMKLYEEMDVFYLNNRLYRVISSGAFVAQKIGFIVSPFSDPDVQDLAYSTPMDWKQGGRIQWEYMWEFHKGIMKFAQEEYGRPIRSSAEMFAGRVQNKLRNIYYQKINKQPQKLSMNPLEYWWDKNEQLRNSLDSYFKENIDRLNFDPELKKDVNSLYSSPIFLEKTLALTAVGIMKNYFRN